MSAQALKMLAIVAAFALDNYRLGMRQPLRGDSG